MALGADSSGLAMRSSAYFEVSGGVYRINWRKCKRISKCIIESEDVLLMMHEKIALSMW